MFRDVLFNVPLLFLVILSFTAKLPYGQLVMWQKRLGKRCLQQRNLWQKYLELAVTVREWRMELSRRTTVQGGRGHLQLWVSGQWEEGGPLNIPAKFAQGSGLHLFISTFDKATFTDNLL